jgi:hypothetical protein
VSGVQLPGAANNGISGVLPVSPGLFPRI